jgi:hypothetical protein
LALEGVLWIIAGLTCRSIRLLNGDVVRLKEEALVLTGKAYRETLLVSAVRITSF